MDNQGVVAGGLKGIGEPEKDSFIHMMDEGGLTMHESLGLYNRGSVDGTNTLVAEADPQDGDVGGQFSDELVGDPGVFWGSRAWRDNDLVWMLLLYLGDGDLIISKDL